MNRSVKRGLVQFVALPVLPIVLIFDLRVHVELAPAATSTALVAALAVAGRGYRIARRRI